MDTSFIFTSATKIISGAIWHTCYMPVGTIYCIPKYFRTLNRPSASSRFSTARI